MANNIDVQVAPALSGAAVPTEQDITRWLTPVFSHHQLDEQEITVRFVDEKESADLNSTYRHKPNSTNVLSFPFEAPPGIDIPLLGDLVICVPVIEREAIEQNKALTHHYAHMVIHGGLHLLGYDHIDDDQAEQMEALEINLLQQLSIDDPYQDL